MSKLVDRFLKKKEVIHDGGVHQRTNPVDFIVITGCSVIIIGLIVLAVLAYATPAH